jgi:hypothetical protein
MPRSSRTVVPGDARCSRLPCHLRARSERAQGAGDACSGAPARERGRHVVPFVSAPNWTVLEKKSAARRACAPSERSSREASAGGLSQRRGSVRARDRLAPSTTKRVTPKILDKHQSRAPPSTPRFLPVLTPCTRRRLVSWICPDQGRLRGGLAQSREHRLGADAAPTAS